MTVLGRFGLFLMILVCKLAPVASAPNGIGWHRVRGVLARRALDGIGAIGWLFDRFGGARPAPLPDRLATGRYVRHG